MRIAGVATQGDFNRATIFGFGSHEMYALDETTDGLWWQLHTRNDGPTAAVVRDGAVLFNTESGT